MIKRFLIALAVMPLVQLQAQVIFQDDFEAYGNDAQLTAVWARINGSSADIGLVADPLDASNQVISSGLAANRLRYVVAGGITPSDAAPVVFSFDFYTA